MITYGFKKSVEGGIDQVEEKTRAALKEQGFGVLTRIDLREKFKEKLNTEFKNYRILGACNPSNAFAALRAEEDIGLMLPCNVILYESDGRTTISVIKPSVAMSMIDNQELETIAEKVESSLKLVFDRIS